MIDEAFAVDLSSPGARRLFEYWVHGEGALKIRWGTDGSFARCERHLTGKVRDPQGLCAEYHKAATGEWPAEKGIQSSAALMPRLRWRGLLGLIGTPTGDKREILAGALSTRQLPLPLLWQRQTVTGKHDGSVVIGLIDKVDIGTHTIYGEGDLFTPDPKVMPRLAEDVAELRYIAGKGLGGPSIDIQLDDLTYEYRGDRLVITSGRLAGATLVHMPAFAETHGAFEIYENDVLVASFGVMRPFDFITLEQWEESKHPRDAEGKFKEKPGGDVPGALPSVAAPRAQGGVQDRIDRLIRQFGQENEFGVQIREDIARRGTTQEVAFALEDEIHAKTGRFIRVDLSTMDVESAKEHAEGIVRVMEVFPSSRLNAVGSFNANTGAQAHATYEGNIEFNLNWSGRFKRSFYLDSLRLSTESGWHPPGSESPAFVAIHEAIHNVHQTINDFADEAFHPNLSSKIYGSLDPSLANKRGLYGISQYGDKNIMELVAEASADVFSNGEAAAPNSKKVFRVLVEEYEKKHHREIVVPESRPQTPQEGSARRAKEGVNAVIEKRDPSILKGMTRDELREAAEKLNVPLEPGIPDEMIRVKLLKAEQARRRAQLTGPDRITRTITEYVDSILVRDRDSARKVLENRNYPPSEIAKDLSIKVNKGESDDEINNKILDKIFGPQKKELDPDDSKNVALAIIDSETREEAAQVVARLKGKQLQAVGDQFHMKLRGTVAQKRQQLVDIIGQALDVGRGTRGDKDKEQQRFQKHMQEFRDMMRKRIGGERPGPEPEPAPEPKPEEPRFFKKKIPGVGVAFQWFYEHNGQTHGPFTQKAVARLDFEGKQQGKKDLGLKDTDLDKFQADLKARVEGSSATKVAQELGVSPSTVRNWVRGSRPRNLDVVSNKLKEVLGPEAPVVDVDTVKVHTAFNEIFEDRNPDALRGLDTEALRAAVKELGIKPRSNASRDTLIRVIFQSKQRGENIKPGFGNFVDLLYASSRTGGRKYLDGRDPDDLLEVLEETGVDIDERLVGLPDHMLIKRILDQVHKPDPTRLRASRVPDPLASEAMPGFDLPDRAMELNGDIKDIRDLIERIDNDLPNAQRKKITEGQMGGVKEKITFPDGTEVFGKQFAHGRANIMGLDPQDQADAELLTSKLGRSLGVSVPRVYRSDRDQIYTDWVDGPTSWQLESQDIDKHERLMQTNAAKRIGLLDMITGNSDRNQGNMIAGGPDRLTGIDNSLSWTIKVESINEPNVKEDGREGIIASHMQGPAEKHFTREVSLIDNPATPADIAFVRAKLTELEPEFQRTDRMDWYRYSHEVLNRLEPHAKGRNSIFGDVEDIQHERQLFDDLGAPGDYHQDLTGFEDMISNLEKINDESVRRGRVILNTIGRKERLFFPDGTSMFLKDLGTPTDPGDQFENRGMADREQLAAIVGQAIGARTPRVLRDREGRIASEWVDGKPKFVARNEARDIEDWHAFHGVDQLDNTKEGRLIGLLDVLTGNKDRHDMNVIIDNDGKLNAVGNDASWRRPQDFYGHPDDPERRFIDAIYRSSGPSIINEDGYAQLTEDDIDEIQRRLEALKPQFEYLGREQWLKYSIDVLQDLRLITDPRNESIFGNEKVSHSPRSFERDVSDFSDLNSDDFDSPILFRSFPSAVDDIYSGDDPWDVETQLHRSEENFGGGIGRWFGPQRMAETYAGSDGLVTVGVRIRKSDLERAVDPEDASGIVVPEGVPLLVTSMKVTWGEETRELPVPVNTFTRTAVVRDDD